MNDPSPQRRRLIGPLEAALRRPFLVVLPLVQLTAVLLFVQANQPTTHTAEGQLVVGSLETKVNALPGVVTASQQLASTYARFLPAAIPGVAFETGLSEDEVRRSLSATNIPQSPVIRITATSDDADRAVDIARASMAELTSVAAGLTGETTLLDELITDRAELLTELSPARVERELAASEVDRLNALRGTATPPSPTALDTARDALITAQAAQDVLELRYEDLDQQIQGLRATDPVANEITELSAARWTEDDRRNRLMLGGILGILLGGALGVLLATLSANHWRLLEPEPGRNTFSSRVLRRLRGGSGAPDAARPIAVAEASGGAAASEDEDDVAEREPA